MDGWLKALIAVACIVVIAGGGYYGWTEWRTAQVKQESQSRAQLRARCLAEIRRPDFSQETVTVCLLNGSLTQADIDDRVTEIKRR